MTINEHGEIERTHRVDPSEPTPIWDALVAERGLPSLLDRSAA